MTSYTLIAALLLLLFTSPLSRATPVPHHDDNVDSIGSQVFDSFGKYLLNKIGHLNKPNFRQNAL